VANSINHRPTWLTEAEVASIVDVVVETELVEEAAETLVGVPLIPPGTALEGKALPSRSAKFVTSPTTPPLSAGTGSKRTSSPTITKVQVIRLPMVLTPIGMPIVELPTILQVISGS
jgi:hypothetical protein